MKGRLKLYMNSCNFSERKDIKSLEGLDIPEICKGDFKAYKCPNLQSLKGGPREVSGDYFTFECDLRSLEGAPEKLGRLDAHSNPHLQSLKGGPKEVSRSYNVSECDLRSLEGTPEKVDTWFSVHSNPHLQSLKGGPKEVGGDYYAYSCDLRSLEGAPEKVGDWFSIHFNPHLQSLKGGPKEVGGDYYIHDCDLRSLEGAPERVGGSFEIQNNPKLTIDNILRQKDFQKLFKNLKNYEEIKADPEIQDFLEFLKKLSEKGKTDIPVEKLKFLWKTSKSLK